MKPNQMSVGRPTFIFRIAGLVAISAILAACGGLFVRQQGSDAWVGVPVKALDTHSLMNSTVTPGGIEIGNYASGADIASFFVR
jgi:hypothetical protein